MSESLEELAIRAVACTQEAARATQEYNDFGSFLGFQDEITDTTEQLMHDLRNAICRARRITRRVKLWETGKHEVDMLSGQKSLQPNAEVRHAATSPGPATSAAPALAETPCSAPDQRDRNL